MVGKLDFFIPLGFDIQRLSDHGIPKINLFSVRDLKQYLNKKGLIDGQGKATISKSSALIFETYFN